MSHTPALAVEALHKSFGDHRAVDGVSFEVAPGETVALLGPNGAGKSTTLSMVAGLVAPDRGDARILGHSVTREPKQARAGLGLVPQDLALYDDLGPEANLAFWGRMAGLSGAALKRRVEEVLADVGLTDRRSDAARTLSGGMKRRLNIGIALLHRPGLVIMDEPTVGIDPQSRRHILDGVKALPQQGAGVVYTTHYMEEAAELADRIVIVDHGKVIAEGTHDALLKIVGEHDRVVLALQAPGEAVALALAALEGVLEARAEGETVTAVVDGADRLLPRLLEAAAAAGGRVASVQVKAPDLEAVFLHLTGRTLRD